MAEAIKSVLFVDYDSIHRSLAAGDAAAAERLALRAEAWIGAIEAGSLFSRRPQAAVQHRILVRRCYADPSLLGNDRSIFLSNGFQIVDCPPAEGRERNAAATHLILDTIDALEHPTNYDEFILLSAETDLSPVLIRLRAHNRTTAIYANAATAESYKTIADATVDESLLVSVLLSDGEQIVDDQTTVAAPPADRSDVERLARKINAATNVPLFAPRTFAELFRSLVDEIAESGYHFQTTAENVATRMTNAGRDVTRRQVVFVVKGLALKGHVFSTDDTPERLAEVFRVQVLYLAENAGIELDENEHSILSSWIIGLAPPASTGTSPETAINPDDAISKSAAEDAANPPSARPATTKNNRSSKRKQSAPTQSARSEASTPTQPKSAEATSNTAAEGSKPAANRSEKPAQTPASATQDTNITPAPMTPSRSGPTPAQSKSKPTPSPAPPDRAEAAVESSILAAIAEAVDVFVEDGDAKPRRSANSAPSAPRPRGTEPSTGPATDNPADGDEIGDEIQRILASYDRDQDQGSNS